MFKNKVALRFIEEAETPCPKQQILDNKKIIMKFIFLILFVLYYQNEVVSSGTLFMSNNAVMLHNLATKTSYTKRGLGRALTMYMMHHAKQLGYRHCFLDSSEDGFNLYSNIGFKVYSTTTIYTEISNK